MSKFEAKTDECTMHFIATRDGLGWDIREDGTVWQGDRRIDYQKARSSDSLYHYVDVRYNGKSISMPVHRMVYAKFLGELDRTMHVNHIDSDPTNNHKDNLELVTASINNLARYLNNPQPVTGNRNMTQETADEIRAKHASGWSYSKIIEHYPVKSKGHVSEIINRKIYNGLTPLENKIANEKEKVRKSLEKIAYWEAHLEKTKVSVEITDKIV